MLVLALSLTGYLLPWDQNGYWSTAVSTNLVGMSPGIGTALQTILVGGASYGHHTLTPLFAFPAGPLSPPLRPDILGPGVLLRPPRAPPEPW